MIRELGHRYALSRLLPHAPPMLLLDSLVEYGHDHVICDVTVREDSMFFEPGRGVPAWVGAEYMAQTLAVFAGILRAHEGKPAEIALLLGTRAYECSRAHFAAGERLLVRADMLMRDLGGVSALRCTLGDGVEVWARAEIKAYEPADLDAYLATLNVGEPA